MIDASQVWAVIVAAFGASTLTSVGSRWVAGFQASRSAEQDQARRDHELERDRRADERRLRDAKAERLRADTVVLAVAADAFEGAGKQLMILRAGDTREARAERVSAILAQETEMLGPALMRIQLETGAEEIAETYKRAWKAFVAFRVGSEMMEETPGRYVLPNIAETLETLESGVAVIVANAKAKLAELERPI